MIKALYILMAAGLLGACAMQEAGQTPLADGPPKVEELMRLPPIFPGEDNAPLAKTSGRNQKTIYVPAYSHVYYNRGQQYLLSATLSIRNISLTDAILITSVRYYDTYGRLVKKYSKKTWQIPPMATAEFFVQDEDTSGGSGANFIVMWETKKGADEPLIEAVMIGTSSGQGIAFTSSGRPIQSKP
jgi:Protein of unknown function (DUF3124)